jgi:diguanylate cyclase (GGDEF)-like protein
VITEDYLFEALFEMIPFGVYVVDVNTYQVIYANRSYQEAHGDCVGKICYEAIYKEDSPCHYCKIRQLVDEQSNPNNTSLIFERFNEYNDYWYQHYEKTLCWPDGRVVKYTIEVDICELKATQNRLAEAHALLALKNRELLEINRHDELTKVFNRSHLNHVLANKIYNAERYQKSFSVVLIDIDDFKKINDSYGHLVGDAVLIEIAQLINNNIRQSDCFGRWGGEEFMIIAPYIKSMNDTKSFVEKLCNLIAAYFFSAVGNCTCSFGVAHCTPHDTMISIVKNADDALYFAKSHGKNQVIIFDEIAQK